jgi:hypothetical protein
MGAAFVGLMVVVPCCNWAAPAAIVLPVCTASGVATWMAFDVSVAEFAGAAIWLVDVLRDFVLLTLMRFFFLILGLAAVVLAATGWEMPDCVAAVASDAGAMQQAAMSRMTAMKRDMLFFAECIKGYNFRAIGGFSGHC